VGSRRLGLEPAIDLIGVYIRYGTSITTVPDSRTRTALAERASSA
jgi:hypothetical protein